MSHVVFKSYVSHVFSTTNLDFFVTSLTDHLSFSTCSMKDNQLTDSDG